MLHGLDLRRLSLADIDLSESKMQNANLTGCDLTGAILIRCDMQNAELCCAILRQANLTDIILEAANLQNVNLRYANLSQANLNQSNCKGADLGFAQLQGGNLRKANLTRANLHSTNLTQAELNEAVLFEVKHLDHAIVRKAQLRQAKLGFARRLTLEFEWLIFLFYICAEFGELLFTWIWELLETLFSWGYRATSFIFRIVMRTLKIFERNRVLSAVWFLISVALGISIWSVDVDIFDQNMELLTRILLGITAVWISSPFIAAMIDVIRNRDNSKKSDLDIW